MHDKDCELARENWLMKYYVSFPAIFCVFSTLVQVSAYLPVTSRKSPCFSLSLHPDQAADLEACAYQVVRENFEQKDASMRTHGPRLTAKVSSQNINLNKQFHGTRGFGPISWCRKNLWPFRTTSNVGTKLPWPLCVRFEQMLSPIQSILCFSQSSLRCAGFSQGLHACNISFQVHHLHFYMETSPRIKQTLSQNQSKRGNHDIPVLDSLCRVTISIILCFLPVFRLLYPTADGELSPILLTVNIGHSSCAHCHGNTLVADPGNTSGGASELIIA